MGKKCIYYSMSLNMNTDGRFMRFPQMFLNKNESYPRLNNYIAYLKMFI